MHAFRRFPIVAALALSSILPACASEADGDDVSDVASEAKGNKSGKAHRFDVLTHNIGGGAENDAGAAGIAYTFQQIDSQNPDVVMLEEVCTAQYDLFKARYKGWNVLFSQMSAAHPGCGNQPKGQVLASRRPMKEVLREDLGDVDPNLTKHFTLLCGAVEMPDTARKVVACVTHLRAEGADAAAADAARGRQIERIHTLVRSRVKAGQAVVLAGDFNTSPKRDLIDPLYRVTRDGTFGAGLFDEADQTDARRVEFATREVTCAPSACRSGAPTTTEGPKLDFVFFSHNRVGATLGATPLGAGGSGHKLYRAWADLDL